MNIEDDMNIEELKNNQTAWKWLDEDDCRTLLEAKKHNAMVFMDKNGLWKHHKGQESMGVVYRIDKQFNEKPLVPNKFGDGEATMISMQLKIGRLIDCIEYIYQRLDKVGTK